MLGSPYPIKFGKFKGHLDDRNQYCHRFPCRGCDYCGNLPYVQSILRKCNMRQELKEENGSEDEVASESESNAWKLELDTLIKMEKEYIETEGYDSTKVKTITFSQIFGLKSWKRRDAKDSSSRVHHQKRKPFSYM